jgi:hypothetical protein
VHRLWTDLTITYAAVYFTAQVLHGADHDVEWLQRDFHLYLVNLFDTGQVGHTVGGHMLIAGGQPASGSWALQPGCLQPAGPPGLCWSLRCEDGWHMLPDIFLLLMTVPAHTGCPCP